jgi:hypothetical protein
MNEADEEHHVARVLIAELDSGRRGDDHRYAKFTVLSENVRHHIKEEENEMLPKTKGLDIDFMILGKKMLDRKKELETKGIPADAEHAMVAKAGGKADTPATAARKTSPTVRKPAKTARSVRTAKGRRVHASR